MGWSGKKGALVARYGGPVVPFTSLWMGLHQAHPRTHYSPAKSNSETFREEWSGDVAVSVATIGVGPSKVE